MWEEAPLFGRRTYDFTKDECTVIPTFVIPECSYRESRRLMLIAN